MRQRLELIQEIRNMQAASAARQPKVIDITETAGYGLMCEMSIAEVSFISMSSDILVIIIPYLTMLLPCYYRVIRSVVVSFCLTVA